MGWTDDDRYEPLRATDSRENARSNAPCFDSLLFGDSLREPDAVGESGAGGELTGEIGLDDDRGEAGLLSGGNHFDRSDGGNGYGDERVDHMDHGGCQWRGECWRKHVEEPQQRWKDPRKVSILVSSRSK